MKRAVIILATGGLLGMLAGAGIYRHQTATERALWCCKNPEMAWLQHEFQMTDGQLNQVETLDASYQASCADVCRRIQATNELVRLEFTSQATNSLKLEHLLAGAAQVREECQLNMLKYCQAVSREMPPQQGKRYLQWVCDRVLSMPGDAAMPNASASGHGN